MDYSIKPFDSKFVENNIDFEQYASVYSKQLRKIFEPDYESKDESTKEQNEQVINKFVTISFEGRRVYRKCIARNGVNSNEIKIGYRTQEELHCKEGDLVSVLPTCWFLYYWKNSETYKRREFQILCISLFLAIISGLISLLSLFVALPLNF